MTKQKIFLYTTYVDAQTNIPMCDAPCRNGHKTPDGVVPVFDIVKERWSDKPVVYGWAEEGFELQSHMVEVGEECFWNIFKDELKQRVKDKRKEIELGGLVCNVGDKPLFLETDMDTISRLGTLISSSEVAELEEVDFKTVEGYTTLSIEELKQMSKAITLHVQRCFSWEKELVETIDGLDLNLESVGDTLPILESINTFGIQQEEGED